MYTLGEMWLYIAKGSVLLIMFVFTLIQWYWCRESEEEPEGAVIPYLDY
jgi:hypothetical protein